MLRPALHGRFQLFRLLQHPDNLLVAGAARCLFHPDHQISFLQDGSRIYGRFRAFFHRNGFAGERCLIYHGLSLRHNSVQGNHASHGHADQIPFLYLMDGDLHISFLPLQPDLVHIQSHTPRQVRHRFFVGPLFHQLAHSQKKHDRGSRLKVPADQGNGDSRRVQHRHLQFPPKDTVQACRHIAYCLYTGPNRTDGRRNQGVEHRPVYKTADQPLPVFHVQPSGGTLRHQFLYRFALRRKTGDSLQQLSSLPLVEDHPVSAALVHLGALHSRKG